MNVKNNCPVAKIAGLEPFANVPIVMILIAIIISVISKNKIWILTKLLKFIPIIKYIPNSANTIAKIVFNFGFVLKMINSIIGMNKKYDDTTLETVDESKSLEPRSRKKLNKNDSTDNTRHCNMCRLSILNISLKKTTKSSTNPIADVMNKNSKVLIFSGTPA